MDGLEGGVEVNPSKQYNEGSRLENPEQACHTLNMSRGIMMKLAREAGAVYKYGRLVRIDTQVVIDHLRKEHTMS